MKKTEKLNIGGFSFNVEEDAAEALAHYIDSIHKVYENDPAAKEICSDIEERIGELLAEKSGSDRVVTLPLVDGVKSVMGEFRSEVKSGAPLRKRLFRDADNKFLGGVFSGIAAYTDTDVVIYRILYVVFLAASIFLDMDWADSILPLLLLSYAICWICIPEAKNVEQKCLLHGKPVSIGDFGETPSRGKGGSAPAFRLVARVLLICLGVYLLLSGCSNMVCAFCLADIVKAIESAALQCDFPGEFFRNGPAISPLLTKWPLFFLTAAAALISLWKIYVGTLLIVNRKAPSWRPGLILFLLFLASSIAAGIFLCRAALAIPHIII